MNAKPHFPLRGLSTVLLATLLAGCGGGGGHPTPASPSATAAGSPSGSSHSTTTPAPSSGGTTGSVTASATPHAIPPAPSGAGVSAVVGPPSLATGGPTPTADVAASPLQKYVGLYKGELTREAHFEIGNAGSYSWIRQNSELWVYIDAAGHTSCYSRGEHEGKFGVTGVRFFAGTLNGNPPWRVTMSDPGGHQTTEFEFSPIHQEPRALRAQFDDPTPWIYQGRRPLRGASWVGRLNPVQGDLWLNQADTTVFLADAALTVPAWNNEFQFAGMWRKEFGARLELRELSDGRWSLKNSGDDRFRIKATLSRSATTGACDARIRLFYSPKAAFQYEGLPRRDEISVDGHCAITRNLGTRTLTLFSGDREAHLWLTGELR